MKKRVIFICTGNSCRSQMAEGFLKEIGGDKYQVVSAGLEPSQVNPNAIKVMHEIGIDISQHTSKNINLYEDQEFDFIITACDNANERCPLFPGAGKRIHWSFQDPAEAVGAEEEVMKVFRKVRDQIKLNIEEFLGSTN